MFIGIAAQCGEGPIETLAAEIPVVPGRTTAGGTFSQSSIGESRVGTPMICKRTFYSKWCESILRGPRKDNHSWLRPRSPWRTGRLFPSMPC